MHVLCLGISVKVGMDTDIGFTWVHLRGLDWGKAVVHLYMICMFHVCVLK